MKITFKDKNTSVLEKQEKEGSATVAWENLILHVN